MERQVLADTRLQSTRQLGVGSQLLEENHGECVEDSLRLQWPNALL